MTRNRGGEGDLTEFANQISSLVYEILSEARRKGTERSPSCQLSFLNRPSIPSSCVLAVAFKPVVFTTKLLPFGNNSGEEILTEFCPPGLSRTVTERNFFKLQKQSVSLCQTHKASTGYFFAIFRVYLHKS